MNNYPREKLIYLIKQNGIGICDNPKLIKSLLMDYCGSYRKEIMSLITVLQECDIKEIASCENKDEYNLLYNRMLISICENTAISKDAIVWALDSWASAFSVVFTKDSSTNNVKNNVTKEEYINKDIGKEFIRDNVIDSTKSQFNKKINPSIIFKKSTNDEIYTLNSLSFSIDRREIAAPSNNLGEVGLWDCDYGDFLRSIYGTSSGFASVVQYSPDGKYLAVGHSDGMLNLYTINDNHRYTRIAEDLKCGNLEISSISFSPDSKKIIAGCKEGNIYLWDVENKQLDKSIDLIKGEACNVIVKYSFNGKYIVAGDNEGKVIVWNSKTYEKLWDIKVFKSSFWAYPISSIDLTPDDKFIAIAGLKETAVYSLFGVKIRSYKVNSNLIGTYYRPMSFSPDGRFIALVGDDKMLQLWDREQDKCYSLSGYNGQIKALAFSSDSKYIITSCNKNNITLWSIYEK